MSMKIRILAFGIAKDILGARKTELDLPETSTLGDLRNRLLKEHPSFSKLNSLRFAVKQDYVSDAALLEADDEVVIIPPVSGG